MGLRLSRIVFFSPMGATVVEILEKDYSVLFCLLCQDRIQKNFKVIETFISARIFHTRHLINIIISFEEKKVSASPSFFSPDAALDTAL